MTNKNKVMIHHHIFALFFCLGLSLMACESEEDTIGPTAETDTESLLKESFFNSGSLQSFQTTTASLEDGTTAECYVLTFSSNAVEGGPFCPETIEDVAGLGIYDGATNPGMRVFSRALLEAIEQDGYDMVNEDGTVNIDDFSSNEKDQSKSYCLAALPDDNLVMTFTIPAVPKLANTNNEITEVELVGLSLDGISLNGSPPSAISGPAMMGGPGGGTGQINFPSFDPCGGHHDPSGYYHWHFVPQIMNQVLTANDITEVRCTEISQTADVTLFGFAKDGFPIYAYATEPTDLDDCGGRTAATDEFPDGVYHYVASTTSIPNIPKCLKGVAARNAFRFQ